MGDSATDNLPKATLTVSLEGDGVVATPPRGNTLWPIGTILPYSFSEETGYETPVTFVDDTSQTTSGTMVMSINHTITSAADSMFALRPGISDLRARLRAIVTAQNKPAAFADYLTWFLNTGSVAYSGSANLNDNIRLASYLEFDPDNDAAALASLDDAMAGYAFQISRNGSSYTVTTLAPPNYGRPVIARRGPGRTRSGSPRAMNATAPPDSTSFIFVNGIRTTVDGWAETGVDAKLLINDPRFPRSSATMYWNANLHGTIMMFVNNTVRCDGRGARDSKFRKVLTTLKRWAVCKTLGLVTTFLVDDLLFSATEFVQQQWNVGLPDGPEDPDSDHLAVLASSFHHANQNTIVVAHSQGNMVFNDALPHIASYDSGLQFSVCTGLVSLASPITRGTFRMDTTLLRGLTINGDLLLQLQLPNDFPPLPDHHRNETTAQRDSALASMHPAFRGFANFFKWGFAIHDVAPNYFRGMLADTVLTRFSEVYSACPH